MRRKLGSICMFLGAALVLAALSLFLWNRYEDARAGNAVDHVLPRIAEKIQDAAEDDTSYPDPYSDQMTETEIDGYYYIGYISISSLGLELPVMTDWSYPQLKISPCRYYGSTKTEDLVIAAHNYSRHFGNIKSLSVGDAVYFTDMDGVVTAYVVEEIDTLSSTDVEEMTDSGYPLTLFTCTYGGQSRVTVRCKLSGENGENISGRNGYGEYPTTQKHEREGFNRTALWKVGCTFANRETDGQRKRCLALPV